MNKQLNIMVIAGEISGDNHGSKLIKAFKEIPDIKITAIGGDKMATVSDDFVENIVSRAVVGFVEVIKVVPYLIKLKNRVVKKYFNHGLDTSIDALVLLDYPGFNIRIAKIANKMNIPVYYYITPQVWAWGRKRIGLLSRICRKMFCMFDFEKELFINAGGQAEFVGHPIIEDIPTEFDIDGFNRANGIEEGEKVVALLPGSRVGEVKRHLPVICEAIKGIEAKVILGKASSISEDLIKDIAGDINSTEDVYTLLKRADAAIVSSGTSTLETAVIGTPFVTIYKVAPFSYMLAKMLVKIDYICMVNILFGQELVSELIQSELNSSRLKKEITDLLESKERQSQIKEGLDIVTERIKSPQTSERTAKMIVEDLRSIKGV